MKKMYGRYIFCAKNYNCLRKICEILHFIPVVICSVWSCWMAISTITVYRYFRVL